ncbi:MULTISPECIES: DUF3291 domain-containing protein [Burkholderia]|uniref:DUF3291 domain-containing protein n=1 Tax=Burkholderia TaxID=32008 RepID=UPI0015814FD0|nr:MULTISPECIES: DUF3291 domain-containing protein [Burkholderia]MBN3794030.1 DUF3291 domain-containing protein [Burkholderia sp. Ac-20392]
MKNINAPAERSPGLVWRLQTSEGDVTGVRGFDDPLMLLNMSLWESVDSLRRFVYQSGHGVPFRNAAEWFHHPDGPRTALWRVPQGCIPTPHDDPAYNPVIVDRRIGRRDGAGLFPPGRESRE